MLSLLSLLQIMCDILVDLHVNCSVDNSHK